MKQKKYALHKFAFLIPLLLSVIICIGNGVYPLGKACVMHMDMYHQYCPFFVELLRKIRSMDSLMYSWNIGLGSDFISVFVYYLSSPLNWLLIFCPSKFVIEFMTILIVFKMSFAGLAAFIYLKEHYREESYMTLVFSTAYAFSGFMAAYSWNIMWLDGVALFPLILLGLERLVKDGKVKLYYISLAIAILSNYYIGIMICMYLAIYFVYLFFINGKGRWRAFLRFAFYSLLAGGTAAILILPELKILSYSGSSVIDFPETAEWYFNIVAELSRMVPTAESYNGAGNWPNLYAGVFCVLLLVIYVLTGRISLKRKIPAVLFVAFFAVSFANNYLDFIWHGFHFPNSLPGRQSFLFIFLIICMSYAVYINWNSIKIWQAGIATIISIAAIITSGFFMDETVTDWYSVLIGVCFVLAYGIILILSRIIPQKSNRVLLMNAFGIIAVLELSVNMAYNGFFTTDRVAYMKKTDDYEKLLEIAKEESLYGFYRVEDTERLTKNDDARYGYPSATQFSSLMNINVSHFYQGVFMEGGKNFYGYNGATPITSAMLSVEYFLSDSEYEESPLRELVAKEGNQYLYRNKFCLPLGFMMSKEAVAEWKITTSSKRQGINSLGRVLGAKEDTIELAGAHVKVEAGETRITTNSDGYYYAEYINCDSDSLKVSSEDGRQTSWGKTTHKYLFDLGYYNAGDVITISNSNNEEIDFIVYRLNLDAVETAFNTLNSNTMELTGFDSTWVEGSINVKKDGYLIFSIPSEEGWSLYVDGKKTRITDFSDTFISVYLKAGKHDIKLSYETPLLKEGAIISTGCLGIFVLSIQIRKKTKDERTSRTLCRTIQGDKSEE